MQIIHCPHCQFEMTAPDGIQPGRYLLCPQCRQQFPFVIPVPVVAHRKDDDASVVSNGDDKRAENYRILCREFPFYGIMEYADKLRGLSSFFYFASFLVLIAGGIVMGYLTQNDPKLVGTGFSIGIFLLVTFIFLGAFFRAVSYILAAILHSAASRWDY